MPRDLREPIRFDSQQVWRPQHRIALREQELRLSLVRLVVRGLRCMHREAHLFRASTQLLQRCQDRQRMQCQRARQLAVTTTLWRWKQRRLNQACKHGTEFGALKATALVLCASCKCCNCDEQCRYRNDSFNDCDSRRACDVTNGHASKHK